MVVILSKLVGATVLASPFTTHLLVFGGYQEAEKVRDKGVR